MRLFFFLFGTVIVLTAPSITCADEPAPRTLFGDWVGTAPDGTEISYSFTKDGGVIWRVKEKEFLQAFPEGLKGKYQLRVAKPFHEIDIYDFEDPQSKSIRFRGILEFVDDQTFKFEGKPSNQGERPKQFSNEAITFRQRKK
jgi:hypothetical protein